MKYEKKVVCAHKRCTKKKKGDGNLWKMKKYDLNLFDILNYSVCTKGLFGCVFKGSKSTLTFKKFIKKRGLLGVLLLVFS